MLLNVRGPRGHMLIEAMVGGVVLALTVASIFSGLTQSSSHVGRAVHSQQALEFAQAQYDRLRERPLSHSSWTVPTAPAPAIVACPDVQVQTPSTNLLTTPNIIVPNSRWRCRLQITRQTDTVTAPFALSPVYRTARIRVVYDPDPNLDPDTNPRPEIAVELELLKCESC